MPKTLNDSGKQQVAMALLLLKDFKDDGQFNIDVTLMILELADILGVRSEYDSLLPKIPRMRITPRN